MTYKIAQISDVHLGYSSGKKTDSTGVNLRLLDGYNALKETVDQIINEKVDCCIVSGDMFHMAHPDIRTIIEAQTALRRLADEGIEVYCIAGNHDATDIRSEIPASGVLDEPFHTIYSYTEPYVIKEISPGIVIHFVSHHAFTDQEETMKQIKLIEDKVNILVSHGSCFDTNFNMVLHCPQEPREVVIPEYIMDMDWDYTWLGHIHERGWIGSKDGLTDTANRKQFYGGSLIRRGFTDRPCKLERGWTLWAINDKEIIPTFFNVTQRDQIDCPKIDATVLTPTEIEEKLISQLKGIFEKYKNEDDLIPVEITPIVRQTVIGITPLIYSSIDWSKCSFYSKHFLTYTLKRVDSSLEDSNLEVDLDTRNTTKNIIDAFDEWVDEVYEDEKVLENKEVIVDKSKVLLKKGQDSVLENGKNEK